MWANVLLVAPHMLPPARLVVGNKAVAPHCVDRLPVMLAQKPPRLPPPPPPPLSSLLLATDGSILLSYSLSASIARLFTSGEYIEVMDTSRPFVEFKDFVDIVFVFDSAAALALGWLLAGAVSGVCSVDWLALPADEHDKSALGLYRVLPTWLLAWPLSEGFKAVAGEGIKSWSMWTTGGAFLQNVDASSAAVDGVALLIVIVLWRKWLLGWVNRWW